MGDRRETGLEVGGPGFDFLGLCLRLSLLPKHLRLELFESSITEILFISFSLEDCSLLNQELHTAGLPAALSSFLPFPNNLA